jgi:hypothetical protein
MAILLDEAGAPLLDESGKYFLYDEAGAPFPAAPLDLTAELYLGGKWTDISLDVYQRQGTSPPVVITRGRPDESSSVSPSSATFDLNNRSGNFSPANPLGAYYPNLNRNTPLRFSIPADANYMRLETDSTSYASTPDAVGLDITGDTEIQIDLWLSNWQPCTLASKWLDSTHKTWALYLNGDGTVSLEYWDGTTDYVSTSTLPLPVQHRTAVKATLRLNDGSGNHVVTFYTAPSIAGSWTILGTAVTVAGTISSLFNSAAPVAVGYSTGYVVTDPHPAYTGPNGRIYEFRLLSGIGGTVKADPVFSAQTAGTTSFADAQGNTWTLGGTAEISSRDYRYHGEMSSLPPKWDVTGTDVHVPVTAGGLLRRIGQRTAPLYTPVRRYYTAQTAPAVAVYWPMDDAAGAKLLGSAAGGSAMYFTGAPKLASSSAFPGSSALPVSNGAQFTAAVSYGGTWTANDVRFLLQIPAGGEPSITFVANIATTGTVALIQLEYTTAASGTLFLVGYNSSGTNLFNVTVMTGVNGQALAIQIAVQQVLSDINVSFAAMSPGGTSPFAPAATPVVSASVGAVTGVQLNPDGILAGTVFGHLAVLPVYTSIGALNGYTNPDSTVTGPLNGWLGEPAAVRYARLAGEEGFRARVIGPPKTSVQMGYQSVASLTTLLQECEDADRGQQFEPRSCLGLGYRTLASMTNQAVTATVDYSLAQAGGTSASTLLEPVYDDRYILNDATITRGGATTGATYQYQLNDGSVMSVSNPPTGAGDYAGSATISLESDGQLPNEAGWMVHMGTVNEARWPVIPVNLARSAVTSLYYPLASVDIGDYVQLANMLNVITYDPVKQVAYQVKEPLGGFFHELEWSCGPESPYETAIYDDAVYGRADTDGSTLASSATSGATSLSVATTSSSTPLWTTAAADFPFDISIGGERITVTNITGSSSPQTFTVTRGINGVTKAQTSGADVRLWFPPVYALT